MPPDKQVDLSKWPTIVDPYSKSKKQYNELLQQQLEQLNSLQQLHFASNCHALLLIFQGMDGAGKDGTIRHVMSGVNLAGCEVVSFKQPSAEELEHDFLWRTTCRFEDLLAMGRQNAGDPTEFFNMAYLAVRGISLFSPGAHNSSCERLHGAHHPAPS